MNSVMHAIDTCLNTSRAGGLWREYRLEPKWIHPTSWPTADRAGRMISTARYVWQGCYLVPAGAIVEELA